MKDDTPLAEVAAHLPPEAAQVLMDKSGVIQQSVLAQLRAVVTYWEQLGMIFDPVAYQAFVNALVASMVPFVEEVNRQAGEIEKLRVTLVGADAMIRNLSERVEADADVDD